jgi:NADH-quinone oxidoreductase subunit K
MLTIGLTHYLVVAAILFTLGVAGIILNRKNIIVILMSVELILLSVNINFVAFSQSLGDLTGQVFALFVLTVAAAEAAIGLAILVAFYRRRLWTLDRAAPVRARDHGIASRRRGPVVDRLLRRGAWP